MKTLLKSPGAPVVLVERPAPAFSDELVTVQILTVGLCRTDLRVASGAIAIRNPTVLGHECAGLVLHDPSQTFAQGSLVAINPLLPGKEFLGLDCDGVLQDVIQISAAQLVAAEGVTPRLAAYLEPVAASMAVLNARITKEQKGVIYHANRISHLTYVILKSLDFNVEWVQAPPSGKDLNKYDYAIETLFESDAILAMMHALKPGGLLVVKSRQHNPTAIIPNLLVAKELTLQAVNYYDFNAAMNWLRDFSSHVEPLLGQAFPLEQWEAAFEMAGAGDAKKIFIDVTKG